MTFEGHLGGKLQGRSLPGVRNRGILKSAGVRSGITAVNRGKSTRLSAGVEEFALVD